MTPWFLRLYSIAEGKTILQAGCFSVGYVSNGDLESFIHLPRQRFAVSLQFAHGAVRHRTEGRHGCVVLKGQVQAS